MKVGIYSPYFDSLGGGGRYVLTVAEYFQNRGDDVTIFASQKLDTSLLGINLERVSYKKWPGNFIGTAAYDLIFFLSDGSIPLLLSKKNILHFQAPFKYSNQRTFLNKLKFIRISAVVCNSQYTKKFVDETYGINSTILYPPVDVDSFVFGKKENIIFSVGRFFVRPHNKKHKEMVMAFRAMIDEGLKGWKLVLLGGIASEHRKEMPQLRKLAHGYPIEIIENGSFMDLKNLYSKSKIYWHAAGFGEDLDENPETAEHFGISTVEAMSSGCVPVVFKGGGQPEIVENGKNGLLWETEEELKVITMQLIKDKMWLDKLSKEAMNRSREFSKKMFFDRLEKICAF